MEFEICIDLGCSSIGLGLIFGLISVFAEKSSFPEIFRKNFCSAKILAVLDPSQPITFTFL